MVSLKVNKSIALAIFLALASGVGYHFAHHVKSNTAGIREHSSIIASKHSENGSNNATANLAKADNPGVYTLPDSSINIKPASGWEIQDQTNAYAAVIRNPDDTSQNIFVRSIILPDSFTPQSEWNNCPSADACGPTPGDKKLSEETFTVNGLNAYKVKMAGISGNYTALIVQAKDKQASNTSQFTEFIIHSDDEDSLTKLDQLVGTIK